MTSPLKDWEMASTTNNFRSAIVEPPSVFGGHHTINTPLGNVHTTQPITPPTLPPRPYLQQSNYGSSYGVGYNSPFNSSYGYGNNYGGGYGSYGTGFGNYGYGNYGVGGFGGYGNSFGSSFYNNNNRFVGGGNGMDPETQFIQLAEESSRPAFQSIESLVCAISNIASMLDSTFFAITSSFRAILGVAANFGRLRNVFAQFLSVFSIFRGLTWLYKKILYMLRLTNVDPSTTNILKEAFSTASQSGPGINGSTFPIAGGVGTSAWPILVFLGFIFTAPYLVMKLIGSVTNSAIEESRKPSTWVKPIKSQAIYDFQASNAQELNLASGQIVYVAPREIQNTHKLVNTGWVLATIDNQTAGLIPVNYIRLIQSQQQINPQQLYQQQHGQQQDGRIFVENSKAEINGNTESNLDNVSSGKDELPQEIKDLYHGTD